MESTSTPSPLEPTLPFELISYIILLTSDANDKPTLGALARTSKLLHPDAVKHLYASTPVLHLKWADPRATSGMQFLSTIHNSPQYAALVQEATIAFVTNPNTIPIRVVINELKKMTNITSLIITPFYGADGRVVDVQVPTPFLDMTFQYRLKRLTWRGLRTFNSLHFLCMLLEDHRATLEAVDLRLDYEAGNSIGYSQGSIFALAYMAQVQNVPVSPVAASGPGDPDDGQKAHPLPCLREIVGSMEVLDVFLPLLASAATLNTLSLVPPHPSIPLDKFTPDISHSQIPVRVLEFVQQSFLTSLSLDLSWGWDIDLERFMVCIPSLESLELRGIRNNESMDSFAIFSPLQKLRSLKVAMSPDTDEPPSYSGDANLDTKIMRYFQPCGLIPSVFAHCAVLQDVRLELDGPSVLRPLWQVWLRLEMSKHQFGGQEALEKWGSFDQYPNLNLFTYMGISI